MQPNTLLTQILIQLIWLNKTVIDIIQVKEQEVHINKKVEDLEHCIIQIILILEIMHQFMNNSLKLVLKLITGMQINWLKGSIINQERGIQAKGQFLRCLHLHINMFLIWIHCLHKVQVLEHLYLVKLLLSTDRIAVLSKMVEIMGDNFKAAHH